MKDTPTMAKNRKPQPIRFNQFRKQLADQGIDDLEEIILDDDTSIFIRLGINLAGDEDDFDDFMAGVRAAEEKEELCKIILGFYEHKSADEQYKIYTDFGGKPHELVALWGTATAARQEALGKLRPRRS
ncbi:hypothetical protein RN607_00710 [Demequina capsici]|uniref:Uncharacterized protein n=1 Tax=Demequina capsici TaxID=3075620 RepID=A0AA96JG48_9MICO|nr:hypothetical protein [Demequina sp. PMTSA13]WNM27554.1 hypothetical protein RN607_00710 [Demequina sp. PMTSA13]